jgi:hypothetical protein
MLELLGACLTESLCPSLRYEDRDSCHGQEHQDEEKAGGSLFHRFGTSTNIRPFFPLQYPAEAPMGELVK